MKVSATRYPIHLRGPIPKRHKLLRMLDVSSSNRRGLKVSVSPQTPVSLFTALLSTDTSTWKKTEWKCSKKQKYISVFKFKIRTRGKLDHFPNFVVLFKLLKLYHIIILENVQRAFREDVEIPNNHWTREDIPGCTMITYPRGTVEIPDYHWTSDVFRGAYYHHGSLSHRFFHHFTQEIHSAESF